MLKFHRRLITSFLVGSEYSDLSFAYRFTSLINGLGTLPTFSLMPKDQKKYNLHYDEVRGQSTTLSTSGSEESSEKEILWKQGTHPCYEYARLR